MRKSMAEVLIEQGQERGRKEGEKMGAARALQRTLIYQLRQKFGKVPTGLIQRIEATNQVEHLNGWLEAVIPASTLGDVGIAPLK